MYFRRYWHWQSYASYAAVWLFWLTFVSVQQQRFYGDGCSAATLYAKEQQNTQIFQKHSSPRQLQSSTDCSEQMVHISATMLPPQHKATTPTTRSATIMTTPRQVVGDVVTEAIPTLAPILRDKTAEMPSAMPPEPDSESDERLVTADCNEVATTKAKADINGSLLKFTKALALKAASNGSKGKDNTTKSFNSKTTTTPATPKIRILPKMEAIKREMAAIPKFQISSATKIQTTTRTTAIPITPLPFAASSTVTASQAAKQLTAKNLKHSKYAINADHLLYDFRANVANLFANESAAVRTGNTRNADEFKNSQRNNEVPNKNVHEHSNTNNTSSTPIVSGKETLSGRNRKGKNNANHKHNEHNNNVNNLHTGEQRLHTSAELNANSVAIALSSNLSDGLLVEPAAVASSDDTSNNNNNSHSTNGVHNKHNKAPHSNERRHIVPEKLQYTKEIRMKQGRLMGITRHFHPSTGLRDVDQYLGLPYAEAPVGSRRFMPPGAPLPWQGLKMARHLPPVCLQQLPDVTAQGSVKMSRGRYKQLTRLLPYLKTESEDCLYLNVYVPRVDGVFDASNAYDMGTQSTKRLPVMVYVHGESFEWNSGNPYDGSVLASYGQVIVVTINYRLGVMGFLKPSIDENTVANFGLLDQIAALHWIKENIASFGGDKDSVTLMGHSTGAACVNYLMISPVASGLFHRAILMSGSAMSDWAVSNHSLQLTMQIAHTLNCPLNDDNEEMLSCLRQKRYQDILKIPTSFPQFSTPLGPIVDGHVIPNQPYKVMGQYTEHFSRYDLLFGVTESESYHTLGALALEEGLRENERDNLLRFYMQTRFDVRPDLALAATLKKYEDMYNNPTKGTNSEHRDVVLDILSDARVVGPLMQTGLFHADVNRRNYMYVFGHNSATGPYANLPHSIAGEELAFIFGAPLAPAGPFPSNSYGAQEKLLSEAVMTYWTNFAKTGNPKAPWKGSFINLHALEWDRYDLDWPEFNKRTQSYMNIGIPPTIGYKYRQIYMNFWNKELPDELNQIANIQRQPYLHTTLYNGADAVFGTSSATAATQHTYPVQRHGGGEVITGHMSQFGTRDNGAEDPVRTLKLLLQEPWKLGGNKDGGGSASDANAAGDTFAENMYNAPPTFGVTKQANDEQIYAMAANGVMGGLAGMGRGSAVPRINDLGGFSEIGVGSGATLAGGNAIYGVPRAEIAEYDNGIGGGGGDGGSDGSGGTGNDASSSTVVGDEASAGNKEEVAKSETTIQLLIGLIAVFIVLNVIIYSTFLLQRKKKAHSMQRKLGGILSYDGTTDDEFKRSKQNDGDESYILDIVRKSNTYEAVKTERSPINGFQMTRQLSTSTVDTHTKVCAWMSAAVGAAADAKACVGGGGDGSSKGGSKKSSSPTFSSLRSSSAGGSFKQPVGSQKVSVAVDATTSARSSSVMEQEPIEVHKLKSDGRNIIICQEVEVTDQDLLTPQNSLDSTRYALTRQHSAATEPCEAELPQQGQLPPYMPIAQHAHSHSDPVDMQHYYSGICDTIEENEKVTSFRGEDVNVTSRDDDDHDGGMASICRTPAQQLQVIKSRNYPKVLPTTNANIEFHANPNDSPPMTLDLRTTNKRNSLPPNSFLPHFSSTLGAGGTTGARYPPLPPPRTISTLGRKPSTRRNSSNITTSPLMLAHDCTAEEEDEPPITQNTLIVGPIVPQQKPKAQAGAGGDTNYSTLKRAELTAADKAPYNSLTSSGAEEVMGTAATKLMHSSSEASLTPANPQIGSKPNATTSGCVGGVTTFLSNGASAGLQSFESRPIAVEVEDKLLQKHQHADAKRTHHTERIYAIQQPTNLPATQSEGNTTAGTPNALTPTLITPTLMNLAGHQCGGVRNNVMKTTGYNNNSGTAIAPGSTDIYAQPNKSKVKAKSNLTAPRENIPSEQSAIAATPSPHIKSPSRGVIPALAHPHDHTSKSSPLDDKAKGNSLSATTTKITTGLGATELTNTGVDKPVTAMSKQTMEAVTAAVVQKAPVTANDTSATVSKTNDATVPHSCMPQMPMSAACSGSLQERLEQKQTEQRQQGVATVALTKHGVDGATAKTAVAALRVPVNCTSATPTMTTTAATTTATRTIADAIAAQLAQTKPLKAALASGIEKPSTVGDSVSRQASLRDSCLSSVSARSTDSRASSACSTSSSGSTASSNASTATGTSSSASSSSSTGTVRTELQQKISGTKRPTQI
ncbi:uncharacterized protein LOC105230312 isoform X1 [Bactrocera dorsalis]|uniref:Uncharacterized protein LOC105230312 isoform X1 n=2 Tax=Bactrocera dorsalis TaxID=27457 RepID=A0A6I9VGR4_BACDO|nr:uncharacterized protein LOC105230312 isoform X1 [Bactrocera dorsalis]XP_049304236.1 uncharacterized protein LOC105230312 isoform X1 [Bactrocera dorsalis]